MGFMHTFFENFKIAVAGSPGTYTATPQFTEWVQLAGVARNASLVMLAGELDGDVTCEIYEATDALGTGAQELTDVTTGETFTNGVSEGGWGGITVRDDQLSDGYTHVAAYVTPTATDALAGCWILGSAYDYPVDNDAAEFLVIN